MGAIGAPQSGLSSAEAQRRLAAEGYNEIAEERPRPWLLLARKLWAPVPWMLEITIIVSLLMARYTDAVIIAFLLIFNAVVGYMQEQRADAALRLLRQRLAVMVRVLRDGRWQEVPARELVRGDTMYLRMGDITPADVTLFEGSLLLDQASLTGESVPVERGSREMALAGTQVKRGEATGIVSATGTRTTYGRTAELVQTARTVSHLEAVVLTIVKYLVIGDAVLALVVLGAALWRQLPYASTLPFVLMLLIASVPVALPATFTLTQALGAQELARHRVLITRLSAIEEAASMDLLCVDKTGTITANQLRVERVIPYTPATSEATVLDLAALASEAATQDPLDVAILAAASQSSRSSQSVPPASGPTRVLDFIPFDPASKRTEARVEQEGIVRRVVKGTPRVVADLAPDADVPAIMREVATLSQQGCRVLAVASGPETGALTFAGLIGLADPPRPDSAGLIADLRRLGVRAIMLTGDTVETASTVAEAVGIGGRVGDASALPAREDVSVYDVFAGVLPEDKFHLVRTFQASGHVVGMTGDGVNDAPALKQAEVGIAVASATDVARAAASIVLTTPGLLDILSAVESSRRIYRRMSTYTVNKIVKTIQIALFLAGAFLVTRQFVITPHLIVLLLFANDFVTMGLSTDRVQASRRPERWHIPRLFVMATALGTVLLGEASVMLWLVTAGPFRQATAQIPTVIFLMLVFSGQGTVYVVREQRWFWRSRPSWLMLAATGADVAVVSALAIVGILMAPVSAGVVVLVLAVAVAFMLALDMLKALLYMVLPEEPVSHSLVGEQPRVSGTFAGRDDGSD